MEDILLFIIDISPFIISLTAAAVVVEIWERAYKENSSATLGEKQSGTAMITTR